MLFQTEGTAADRCVYVDDPHCTTQDGSSDNAASALLWRGCETPMSSCRRVVWCVDESRHRRAITTKHFSAPHCPPHTDTQTHTHTPSSILTPSQISTAWRRKPDDLLDLYVTQKLCHYGTHYLTIRKNNLYRPLNTILRAFSLFISSQSAFEVFCKNALCKFTVIFTLNLPKCWLIFKVILPRSQQ